MKTYIIDTNALISFVTDRNPEQQTKVTAVFQAASHSKAIILCHQNVLTEFIYVMDKVYDVPKKMICLMVRDFIATAGIEIIHDIDFNAVMTFWPDTVKDFGDTIVAALCKSRKKSVIVTFDHKFMNILKTIGLEIW